MKYLLIITTLVSCAHKPPRHPVHEDLVSVHAALNHAQASYLKGCVDAMKELKIPVTFTQCRDKAAAHRRELDLTMEQDL